jgi:predicted PurR-regulated permease PerM
MTIFWVIGVGIVYLGYLAFQSLDLLYMILAGALIAAAVEVFIKWFQRYVPRGIGIAITYIVLMLFISAGIFIIIPFVLQQISIITSVGLTYLQQITNQISLLGLQ